MDKQNFFVISIPVIFFGIYMDVSYYRRGFLENIVNPTVSFYGRTALLRAQH